MRGGINAASVVFYDYKHKKRNENPVYNNRFFLPPVKIKKPANVTRLVTVSRWAQHYVNTEGVVEDPPTLRSYGGIFLRLLRAEGRGRPPTSLFH